MHRLSQIGSYLRCVSSCYIQGRIYYHSGINAGNAAWNTSNKLTGETFARFILGQAVHRKNKYVPMIINDIFCSLIDLMHLAIVLLKMKTKTKLEL